MTFSPVSPTVFEGFYLLGISLIVHIFLVSLIVGIAIIVPFMEWQSYRKNDGELQILSQRLFKYLAMTELVAGVWATWLTVVLAGYWSTLLFIATTKLFVPITMSIIGILISIPSMAAYYYLWGKVSRGGHLLIGVVMVAGTLLVPLGFNAMFAFINYPVIDSANWWGAFLNPLYADFTIHRIFASLTMTTLAFSALYALRLKRSKNDEERSLFLKGAKYGLYIGLPALALQSATGVVYAIQLSQYSPYLASSVLGGIILGSVPTYYNLLPLFITFLAVVVVMWATSFYNLVRIRSMKLSTLSSLLLLGSSLAGVPIAEFMNGVARFPYFVITGSTGLPASDFINSWVIIPSELTIVALLVGAVLMIVFTSVLYVVFAKATKARL